MRHNVSETYKLELLHRVRKYGDLEAWGAFQEDMEETVLNWFHRLPASEAASRLQEERHFVTQTFEQFWYVIIQQQQVRCATLAEVLICLQVCLNGAVLETLRAARRRAVCAHELAKQDTEGNAHAEEVWNWVQATLSSERERRLAYLLYHCGLKPVEIVRDCPQEWSDVYEVIQLRHRILESLFQARNNLGSEA